MADNRQFLFGPGIGYATLSVYSDGTSPTVSFPRQIAIQQSFEVSFDLSNKRLYGQQIYPVAVGIGEGKVSAKLKMGQFTAGTINDVAFGSNDATWVATGETLLDDGTTAHTVAAAVTVGGVTAALTSSSTALTLSGSISGLTKGMLIKITGAGAAAADLYVTLVSGSGTSWVVSAAGGTTVTTAVVTTYPSFTVTNSATYTADLGVVNASTGAPYTPQAPSLLATGNYVPALGVYNFAAVDAAASVLISYSYTVTSGNTITVPNLIQGSVGIFSFIYQGQYGGRKATVQLVNCV